MSTTPRKVPEKRWVVFLTDRRAVGAPVRMLTRRGAITDRAECAGRWRLKAEALRAFRALPRASGVRSRYVATVGTLELSEKAKGGDC